MDGNSNPRIAVRERNKTSARISCLVIEMDKSVCNKGKLLPRLLPPLYWKGSLMFIDKTISEKVEILNEITMKYETAVQAFGAENYLKEFYDFYEIERREHRLILPPYSFYETLRELSGGDVWQPIADETERLFGKPECVKIFEDNRPLIDEMEGAGGLAPFFFVFDIMFCEYEDFTICFISGTNN